MIYFSKTARFVLVFMILLKGAGILNAQESFKSNWQIGLGVGYSNYYGDVSNYRIKGLDNVFKVFNYNKYYVNQPSVSLMVHKKLTPTLGFMIQANHIQFAMSDRYRKKDGSYDTEAMNYARSLNFRTNVQDVGIAFTFSPNNGKIGREDVFFYPSFYLGAGISKFDVKGDLYDDAGNPYNYLLPGNITDGYYETNLRNMQTETVSSYRNVEPYVDLGLALNFRINGSLTLALQTDIKYSASDYLDDVSARYKTTYSTPAEQYAARPGFNAVNPVTLQRGDDNGRNDFYINNRVVLYIGLPKKEKEKKFTPPVIYSLDAYAQRSTAEQIRKRLQKSGDSVLLLKNDSLKKTVRDSLYADSVSLGKTFLQREDSTLQQQLQSITAELQNIKHLLNDQQYLPGRQLPSSDSVTLISTLPVNTNQAYIDSLQQKLTELEKKARPDSVALMYDTQGNLVIADTIAYYRQLATLQQRARQLKADSIMDLQRQLQLSSDSASYYRNALLDAALSAEPKSSQKRLKWYQKIFSSEKRKPLPAQSADTTNSNRYLLQQRYFDSQASEASNTIAQLQGDSAIAMNNQVNNENIYDVQISQLQTMLQRNADSIALMQKRIQRSNDSAAYYRGVLLAETERNDQAQKNEKWYKDLFTSRRDKEKRAEAINTTRESYLGQQQYYDDDAIRMQRRMNDIELRNRQLSQEFETINTFRNNRTPNSYIQPSSPVVIYDRNNGRNTNDNSEINSLRNELDRLRSQVNESNQQNAGADRSPVVQANIDTTTRISSDSAMLRSMQAELAMVRGRLDSLINSKQPVVVAEKPARKEEKFDPSGFPVVSVYFKTGAVVLTGGEIDKLTPFAQSAAKNANARIVLKGFTDPVGNPVTNKAIAGKRTEYVRNFLMRRFGITSNRIMLDEPSVSEGGKNRQPNPLDRRVDCRFE